MLAFYDLDGFKTYNDTFGHQAGDVLLARLGIRGAAAVPWAAVFRLGGDEFCVIVDQALPAARRACSSPRGALAESGTTFEVGCSFGMVKVPDEATDAETAMLLADARMYAHKDGRRPDAASESQQVLVRALLERNRELGQHNDDVAELVVDVCRELGLEPGETAAVRRRRSCTTPASWPSPTRSSTSPVGSMSRSGSSCAATPSWASASWPRRLVARRGADRSRLA